MEFLKPWKGKIPLPIPSKSNPGHFMDLEERKQHEQIGGDIHCPTFQNLIPSRTCSKCGRYFATLNILDIHIKYICDEIAAIKQQVTISKTTSVFGPARVQSQVSTIEKRSLHHFYQNITTTSLKKRRFVQTLDKIQPTQKKK